MAYGTVFPRSVAYGCNLVNLLSQRLVIFPVVLVVTCTCLQKHNKNLATDTQ